MIVDMNAKQIVAIPSVEEAARFAPEQVVDLCRDLAATKQQLDWFKRQLFGQKSERRLKEVSSVQMSLGELGTDAQAGVEAKKQVIAQHTRKVATRGADDGAESLPFFDETRVPVETIELPAPEVAGLSPEDYEVVSHKDSYRLAQRPGSYVVIKYRRAVVKVKSSQALVCAPAPQGPIEGSRADVSFLAGMLIDKFRYHLPLYRQHQRLEDSGITVSRAWLTQIGQQAIGLLEPIYEAQLASILEGRVIAMDETPIKAGQGQPGKLKAAYFWPLYGEQDEVCFPYCPSRRSEHAFEILGMKPKPERVLLTDGYAAYARYAQKTGVTHAQCWAHTRRAFIEAEKVEPEAVAEALDRIRALFEVEARITQSKLKAAKKLDYRLEHAKPIVERFFAWVNERFEAQGLLPSNPLTKALAYARDRRDALEVFLTEAEVPIDTNHLERALRPIPMGRKNWLFAWTEFGAKQVGVVQSLIVTCRLHGLDPYDYLVDVLQRVGVHPAARVADLIPRNWKTHFASSPMRSPLHGIEST
jgi:transposase